MASDAAGDVEPSWSVVIPVKVLARAKSRLTGLTGLCRADLALAMAADTVAAASAAGPVATVLVVTDDADVASVATGLGAVVLADLPGAGLNQALAHGAEYSHVHWPERGCAGLAADLPALRPAELSRALTAAARLGQSFVPDEARTGTTLYAAAAGTAFRPQFGVGSRERHMAAGATELDLAGLGGLRQDVDTLDDLRSAAALGLGPRTRAALSGDHESLRQQPPHQQLRQQDE